jgi:glucosamine-6-phosphate deaminase
MRIIILQDLEAASRWTACHIASRIREYTPSAEKPFVLGLPTGSTPLGTYRELADMLRRKELSFLHVVTFNMDEYIGLPEDHPQSYHSFMWQNFFRHIDIPKENVHILNGNAADLAKECAEYEESIRRVGGIELFLGGMGPDGHIAFNEPGSSLSSRTRIKTLTYDTVLANARFFGDDPQRVPRTALTVGVGTILDAREVLIVVSGYGKARALQKVVEEGVNHMWTVSCLQLHPRAIIVCDEEATLELKVGTVKYFREIESGNVAG